MNIISTDENCAALKRRIVEAYFESNNSCGWRLLASPSSVLDGADVAFIGLNPGGSFQPNNHGEFAMDRGSAYVVETWGNSQEPGTNPLQRQVRALFAGLSVAPESVLAGNLVPFRSPSWKTLESKDYSLEFGESLWTDIIQRARPKLVIGMGHYVFAPLSRILKTTAEPKRVPVGWGTISAVRAPFSGGALVTLPHLSRFGFITRSESRDALKVLFGERWQSLPPNNLNNKFS